MLHAVHGLLAVVRMPAGVGGAEFHDLARGARLVLDVLNEGGDLGGRTGGTLGQFAHLVSHHRESPSRLARARGLDRGIESEQVGLVGDLLDQAHDATNLLGTAAEDADVPRRLAHALEHGMEVVGDAFEGAAAAVGLRCRFQRRCLLVVEGGGEAEKGFAHAAERVAEAAQAGEYAVEHGALSTQCLGLRTQPGLLRLERVDAFLQGLIGLLEKPVLGLAGA